jgi:hypothetical protein
MFGNILNGIPVIGHTKAAFHFLTNNSYEAKKAFNAANRTTAVMAAGAAGAVVGGPVGMVAGGIAAGTAVDTVTSVVKDKPQGVIAGLCNIGEDIENGRIPVASVLKTGLCVGADAVGGYSGAGIVANLPAKMGQNLVKDAVFIATKSAPSAAGCQLSREIAKEMPWSSGSSNTSYTSRSSNTNSSRSSGTTGNSSGQKTTSAGGSGSQPPDKEKEENKKDHEKEPIVKTPLEAFLQIFGVSRLTDVRIFGVDLFSEVAKDKNKKDRLKKLIKILRKNKMLERVVEAVRELFKKFRTSEITFQNFIYLCEMVASHVGDRLARRLEMQRTAANPPSTPFHVRRDENLRLALRDILQRESRYNILNIFNDLRDRIAPAMRTFTPTFISDICATYHYFKHKFVPHSTDILTIEQYMELITLSLPRILSSDEYRLLETGQRRRLQYDRYYNRFGRRVRIVLQIVDGKIVLSTCHILDEPFVGDYEGKEDFETT